MASPLTSSYETTHSLAKKNEPFIHQLAQIVHCFFKKHLLIPALTAAERFVASVEKKKKGPLSH
jgi:hypothetical protein